MDPNRRRALQQLGLLALAATGGGRFAGLRAADTDEDLCRGKFTLAARSSWRTLPMGALVTTLGRSFLGTPYAAHTLETPGGERLVVNLRGLDCTTFVETSLTFARCLKLDRTSYEDYRAQLQLIRYRGGVIAGYQSRLHYFADWIHDNAAKKVVRDVTAELGGEPFEKKVNFMSTHREGYRQLADADAAAAVRADEEALSRRGMTYIPKGRVRELEPLLQEGDILGLTSSVEGLDVAHTGLAVREGGEVRLLHAPMAGKSVELSRKPLHAYMQGIEKQTGVMVARPLDPAA